MLWSSKKIDKNSGARNKFKKNFWKISKIERKLEEVVEKFWILEKIL